MVKKWTIFNFLSYTAGGACWILLLGLLQSTCIVNMTFHIDNLWVKPLGDGLVKNLIGATAFRAEGYGCEDKLIFVAPFYANGMSDQPQMKSLSSITDIASWKKVGSDTISTTYRDSTYKYVLFHTSDGIHMKAFKE